MMNPVPWLQMTNMISYQGLVRTFPNVGRRPNPLSDQAAGSGYRDMGASRWNCSRAKETIFIH